MDTSFGHIPLPIDLKYHFSSDVVWCSVTDRVWPEGQAGPILSKLRGIYDKEKPSVDVRWLSRTDALLLGRFKFALNCFTNGFFVVEGKIHDSCMHGLG